MSNQRVDQGASAARPDHIARIVLLSVMLAVAWLLWSGFFKPLLLGLGAFSCALVVYLSWRMRLFDSEVFALRFSARLFRFWLWLAKEVILSSLEVARVVLSPRLSISPKVVEFESRCAHPVDRAILGNSITLTPGTLTLRVDGNRLTVHALTQAGADDILSGRMDQHVAALRGNKNIQSASTQ
jgi:multicomponent Na+:H+ antiporter subunit E